MKNPWFYLPKEPEYGVQQAFAAIGGKYQKNGKLEKGAPDSLHIISAKAERTELRSEMLLVARRQFCTLCSTKKIAYWRGHGEDA